MNISSLPPMSYANPVGSESAPDNSLPQAVDVSRQDVLNGLNPLQHVPVVGMIYRAATGETIPAAMRVAGAGLLGGPLGMIGAGFMSILEALVHMGPDLSRPSVPVGMSQTGSEAGVEPVTPGTMAEGSYTTLATATPDFLGTAPNVALAQNAVAAYQSAALEWQRTEMVEKGLA